MTFWKSYLKVVKHLFKSTFAMRFLKFVALEVLKEGPGCSVLAGSSGVEGCGFVCALVSLTFVSSVVLAVIRAKWSKKQ